MGDTSHHLVLDFEYSLSLVEDLTELLMAPVNDDEVIGESVIHIIIEMFKDDSDFPFVFHRREGIVAGVVIEIGRGVVTMNILFIVG